MAKLREYFKDDDEYTYVQPHLRRKNPSIDTTPKRGFKLTVGWVIFFSMCIAVSYELIKYGHWVIVVSAFAFITLFYVVLRIIYRDRFRVNKLRKELARRQSIDRKINEEEYLRRQIDSYK